MINYSLNCIISIFIKVISKFLNIKTEMVKQHIKIFCQCSSCFKNTVYKHVCWFLDSGLLHPRLYVFTQNYSFPYQAKIFITTHPKLLKTNNSTDCVNNQEVEFTTSEVFLSQRPFCKVPTRSTEKTFFSHILWVMCKLCNFMCHSCLLLILHANIVYHNNLH